MERPDSTFKVNYEKPRLALEAEEALIDPETTDERTALLVEKSLEKISDHMTEKVNRYFQESEMFNKDNPRSLISLLPPGMANSIINSFKKNPDLLEMYLERDDARFEKLTKPTITDHLLRMSFWNEYYRAQNQGDMMRPHYIYESVCPKDHFFRIIQRPHRAMWILTPPEDQTKQMEVLLAKGMRRLDEILSLPMTSGGKINVAVANLIMKTAIVLDVRLKGQATQKVEITNKHEVKMTAEDVEKRIRELEKDEAEIKNIVVNPAPDKKQDFHEVISEVKHLNDY